MVNRYFRLILPLATVVSSYQYDSNQYSYRAVHSFGICSVLVGTVLRTRARKQVRVVAACSVVDLLDIVSMSDYEMS
jgi:hypothetical protein